ncbi:MAG: hypothetical protein HY749_04450 [Gammaproteobacteria bacterium]|nr:hypothetical protein [Gammaproteobacteria bacterium]
MLLYLAASAHIAAADATGLELEKKIPLGKVSGRIDHLAMDKSGHRLFVAELGNNTVGVIDLQSGSVAHRITSLKQPQGVGYLEEPGALFISNAGDGSVQAFRGNDLVPVAKIELGGDADNVRINAAANEIVVGFGAGALAVVNGKTLERETEFLLKGHPEGFQIDPVRKRVYANMPDAHEMAVIDLEKGSQIAAWDKLPARSNFPLALMAEGKAVAVVFSDP